MDAEAVLRQVEADDLPARLIEIASKLDKSRRSFEEGRRAIEDAHMLVTDVQNALVATRSAMSPRDSDEAGAMLLSSFQSAGKLPTSLCGGRLSVDQSRHLVRIDNQSLDVTEMEYRVVELLALARNNVVSRTMLRQHLYRRREEHPKSKTVDVFISKLRKKLKTASGGTQFIETIPQRGWIMRDLNASGA